MLETAGAVAGGLEGFDAFLLQLGPVFQAKETEASGKEAIGMHEACAASPQDL